MRQVLDAIERQRIIGVLRVKRAGAAAPAARAVAAGGISILEIPATVPGFAGAIAELRQQDNIIVGAASLLEGRQAHEATAAGAAFLVSPCFVPEVWDEAKKRGLLYLPGAATPSEVFALAGRRFELIKVFPAAHLGGPKYIRSLLAAMPGLRLVPTGGVSSSNIREYVNAGAWAVGVGDSILPEEQVVAGDWGAISRLAAELRAALGE